MSDGDTMTDEARAMGLGLSVAERERAVARICFAAQPPEQDLEALGAPERWLIYRNLVRDRMSGMIRVALPRTKELLGEARLDAWFSRWLAEAPPSTHYIRDVVGEMVAFAAPRWRAGDDEDVPPWAGDFAEYETALWEVKFAEDPRPEVVEFDFDKVPVLEPAMRLLHLDYPVHDDKAPGERYPKDPGHVVVYRQADFRAKTWVLNPMAARLVEAWLEGGRTVTETVTEVTAERGVTIDQTFLEKLSAMLADFIERGIVRGSRP